MQENNHQNEPLDILDAPEAETPKRPRPAPAAKRPGAKKPVRRQPPSEPDDDLPPWLAKLVDWIADAPMRLKALWGKFLRLFDSWFYRVYFGVVAVVIIAIVIGLHWLNGVVADYEIAEPSHVAEDVAKLFEDGSYDAIYDLDTAASEISGGDRAFYAQSLRAVSSGKAITWSFASESEGQRRYNVNLDGNRFATFTLVPSGEKTSHGNAMWKLGSITTNVVTESAVRAAEPEMAPYRIQAPADYTVTIDGAPLTDEAVIRRDISILPDKFELPKGVTAPTLVEYGFNSEAETPAIRVTDASGEEMPVSEASENIWQCLPKEDMEMKAKCEDSIAKLAQRIAKFTSQDLSQGSLRESMVPESPAENQIKRFNNGWAPTHKHVSFENMEVSQFYVLSDSCFTCHVRFDFIITSVRNNDYPYPTEYTFCVTKYRGGGRLYNLTFN